MESTSLVKALGLLEATADDPRGQTLAVLASQTGLAKPTAHRILKTLTSLGYLARAEGGVYRQTSSTERLVVGGGTHRLTTLAEPALHELHEKTQETVNLGVLRHDRIVYLQVLESPQPLRRVATPNSVDPFHSTALGRAIASQLSKAEQDYLLSRAQLKAITNRTVVSRPKLKQILADAARDGYTVEVDETDLGVTCIGAPVLHGSFACAAISLSVPTARATKKSLAKFISLICAAAENVSIALNNAPDQSCHSPQV